MRSQFNIIATNRYARLIEEQINVKSAEIIQKINEQEKTTLNDVTLHLQKFHNNDFAFVLEEEPNIQLLVGLEQTRDGYVFRYVIKRLNAKHLAE